MATTGQKSLRAAHRIAERSIALGALIMIVIRRTGPTTTPNKDPYPITAFAVLIGHRVPPFAVMDNTTDIL
ncbi:MAG: hypothetical protein Q8S35_00220 [bacterium]|nr:hypothetical protein [bacterium]